MGHEVERKQPSVKDWEIWDIDCIMATKNGKSKNNVDAAQFGGRFLYEMGGKMQRGRSENLENVFSSSLSCHLGEMCNLSVWGKKCPWGEFQIFLKFRK